MTGGVDTEARDRAIDRTLAAGPELREAMVAMDRSLVYGPSDDVVPCLRRLRAAVDEALSARRPRGTGGAVRAAPEMFRRLDRAEQRAQSAEARLAACEALVVELETRAAKPPSPAIGRELRSIKNKLKAAIRGETNDEQAG